MGPLAQTEGERGWKSQEPTGMRKRSRGREPPGQEEVDREGGQEASRCASAGITLGLEQTFVEISTLQGAQWSGPRGPEAGTTKRRCFYEKEEKAQTDADEPCSGGVQTLLKIRRPVLGAG